jgi:hypothetical protein
MNLWKKTLLATAVAAISTGAMAVDVKTATEASALTYSAEGLAVGVIANDGNEATIPTVKLTAGAEYAVGDIVTLTISGGEFSDSGYQLIDGATVAVDKNKVTFGLINSTENTLTFRVTALANAVTTVGNVFELGKADAPAATKVKLGSIAPDTVVSVTAKAVTATGFDLDNTANDTSKVASVATQWSFKAQPVMDAVVDVTEERKKFVDANAAKFSLVLAEILDANDQQINYQASFTPDNTKANTITVSGNFTAFDGVDNNGTFTSDAGAVTVAEDKQSATIAMTASEAVVDTHAQTFAVGTAQKIIEAGSYSATMKLIDDGDRVVNVSSVNAGKMTLNGASYDIPYIPYGDTTERFVWVTNKGGQTGAITVTALEQNGTQHELGEVATSSTGLIKLDQLIDAKLAEAGVAKGQSIKLNVTVNAPDADITVYAAYKAVAANDRLTVPANSLNTAN